VNTKKEPKWSKKKAKAAWNLPGGLFF